MLPSLQDETRRATGILFFKFSLTSKVAELFENVFMAVKVTVLNYQYNDFKRELKLIKISKIEKLKIAIFDCPTRKLNHLPSSTVAD